MGKRNILSLILILLLVACQQLQPVPASTVEIPSLAIVSGTTTMTPFQPERQVPQSTVTALPALEVPSQTPVPSFLWISPAVPDALRKSSIPYGLPFAEDSASASVRLDISLEPDSQSSTWIYVLVAPFPTTADSVSSSDIQNTWAGTPSGPFSGRPIWIDPPTLAAFSAIWGTPADGAVSEASADQLVDLAWSDRPAWAIIPFELLEPRWKVLSVDGQSPIHNDFDPSSYPLKISFGLQPAAFPIIPGNRDPDKLTVLAMTGVTALVRATADQMEQHGVLYPGEEVRSALRAADITHISNEIPFMAGCPTPDPWTESMRFCSDPRYIDLLEDVGTDVIELTGNHLQDYGSEPLLYTLDMYDQQGWLYFGGGRDLQDSFKPALMEDHGNKLAFIGCNYHGPASDWATDARPGSTPCDFDRLQAEISALRTQGYLPIMTYQYNEYYQPNPTNQERQDFLAMASAGAVIVSGSQSHVPAAMEFSGQAYIHYGLGNLFFDQMSHLMPDGSTIYDTRNVFIDRHIFYDGRYLGTELLTYIIENYSRPRLMTGSERLKFLQQIFSAAGW